MYDHQETQSPRHLGTRSYELTTVVTACTGPVHSQGTNPEQNYGDGRGHQDDVCWFSYNVELFPKWGKKDKEQLSEKKAKKGLPGEWVGPKSPREGETGT